MTDKTRRIVLDEVIKYDALLYELYAAVVMPDHIHILIFPLKQDDGEYTGISKIMNQIKGVSSRRAKIECNYDGTLWQRGYFDQLVHGAKGRAECWDYIVNNPVRAGIVRKWEEYPFVWCKGMKKIRAVNGALPLSGDISFASTECTETGD